MSFNWIYILYSSISQYLCPPGVPTLKASFLHHPCLQRLKVTFKTEKASKAHTSITKGNWLSGPERSCAEGTESRVPELYELSAALSLLSQTSLYHKPTVGMSRFINISDVQLLHLHK